MELVQPSQRVARTDDVKDVIRNLQNSPTTAFLRSLLLHERILLAALLKCVRRTGVCGIPRWTSLLITVTRGSSRLFSNTSSRQLVLSILYQSHLSPFTTHIQLILAEYDHAMRLYPLHVCVHIIPFTHSYHARITSRGGPTSTIT